MATKQETLAAIQAERTQILTRIKELKDLIANRPEVPDDVVAAINAIFEVDTEDGDTLPTP